MKKKLKRKLPGAEEMYGIKVIVDKSLDKYSGKILFPEYHKMMQDMISRIDNLHEFTGKKK